MFSYQGMSRLHAESDTLTPLPTDLRYGLTGVVILASISLLSSFILWAHLTYKLVRYSIRRARKKSRCRQLEIGWTDQSRSSLDLNLGLDEYHFGAPSKPQQRSLSPAELQQMEDEAFPAPNQFVVLLYNLLVADIHQAMAFFLNVVWVARDGVFVREPACWAQGWFISTGDLASSSFIATIALHTYLTVVRDYKPSQAVLNSWIVGTWLFVYGITIAGIAASDNGRNAGGYYVRATAWCWINVEYDNLRLITHYMYIFVTLALTPVTYIAVFLDLRKRLQKQVNKASEACEIQHDHCSQHKGSVLRAMTASALDMRAREPSVCAPKIRLDYHPAFLVYPLIYVVCTLPLALGRVGTMVGAEPPYWYFCMAGALITSNGWLDVVLWGTTRRSVVFGPVENADALGLETFTFMRTPPDREFGNIVWVQGATDNDRGGGTYGAARRGRTWWALMRRIFGGVDPEAGGEAGEDGGGQGTVLHDLGRKNRDSGILGRPVSQDTYCSGHVKKTTASSIDLAWWQQEPALVGGGIAVQKDTVVTVVTVDRRDLSSGSNTPSTSSRSSSPSPETLMTHGG